MIVNLEQDVVVYCHADQLGALRGTEQQRAILDGEIDRKDLWPAVDGSNQSAQSDAFQKIPAFMLGQDADPIAAS